MGKKYSDVCTRNTHNYAINYWAGNHVRTQLVSSPDPQFLCTNGLRTRLSRRGCDEDGNVYSDACPSSSAPSSMSTGTEMESLPARLKVPQSSGHVQALGIMGKQLSIMGKMFRIKEIQWNL